MPLAGKPLVLARSLFGAFVSILQQEPQSRVIQPALRHAVGHIRVSRPC
jgi:hypothetical protein